MERLVSKEARAIATAMWGKINHTYKTNTAGAYCFSCEGHGGFIVAYESIPEDKREFVEKYIQHETGTRYTDLDNKTCFMHPYRTRNGRRGYWIAQDEIRYYVFEEDCAYSIAVLCGINLKQNPIDINTAKDTFYNWYDENNPKVMYRKNIEQKRKDGDADLIISACGEWHTGDPELVEVTTADMKKYLVKKYENCRDQYGTPWLSLCEAVREAV